MEQNQEQAKLIAQMLASLAVIKNADRSETQLAAMAGYLAKHFTPRQVARASEYFIQRQKFFPDVSEYFNYLKPLPTLKEQALAAFDRFTEDERSFGSYDLFMKSASEVSQKIIRRIGWVHPQMNRKDYIEIIEQILKEGGNNELQRLN